MKKRGIDYFLIVLILVMTVLIIGCLYFDVFGFKKSRVQQNKLISGKEFEIQGVTWRTISYYYYPGIYKDIYSHKSNRRLLKKAKKIGANYLLVRAFYSGTKDGGLIGNDFEAQKYLKNAINAAHKQGFGILLVPYVESRDYWNGKWKLSEKIWTETVIKWAKFAQENKVEMFAPGVEMNLILDENIAGEWLKSILPQIRDVYQGKVVTAELFDIERWKILDKAGAFKGYDCIGLTFFPRKEYDGVSDIRSFEDYREYVEKEAEIIDMLSNKYHIPCKLAVPMGLDYWQGSQQHQPVPDASIVAQALDQGLDILKKYNFTGVFISHWASEPDHFGKKDDVEKMLQSRWSKE